MQNSKVIIDKDLCKGCGYCVMFCKQNALSLSTELSESGIPIALLQYPEKCTSCTMCAIMCPEVCIKVYADERIYEE